MKQSTSCLIVLSIFLIAHSCWLNVFCVRNEIKFIICFRWGLAYFLGNLISGRVSGGHLNPIVTVSLNLLKPHSQSWTTVITQVIAQFLGAFLSGLLVFLIYWDGIIWYSWCSKKYSDIYYHNHRFEHQIGEFRPVPQTSEIFATYPAPYVSIFGAFLDQFLASSILLFCLSAIYDKRNKVNFIWESAYLS